MLFDGGEVLFCKQWLCTGIHFRNLHCVFFSAEVVIFMYCGLRGFSIQVLVVWFYNVRVSRALFYDDLSLYLSITSIYVVNSAAVAFIFGYTVKTLYVLKMFP